MIQRDNRHLSPILSLLRLIFIRTLRPEPLLVLSSRSQPLQCLVNRALLLGFVPVACIEVGRGVFKQPFSPDVGDRPDELDWNVP